MFQILSAFLALLFGILAGTLTGLIPGIHINLISSLLILSSAFLLSSLTPTTIIVFIVAMSITHTFIDFIPSTFLGAPDEDTALSIQPTHRFLLKGEAQKAINLTLIGSCLAIFLTLIIILPFIFTIPKTYHFIEKMMSFILIWILIFLVTRQKSLVWPLIITILSGFLGIAALNTNIEQPLLPLLTGLFGTSTIINSIKLKTKIPKQKTEKIEFKKTKKQILKPAIATFIVSPICSLLPGLGSSQAAIISSQIIKQSKEQFLILLGSINTLVMSISFVTFFLIQKSRSGSAAALSEILQTPLTPKNLTTILITILATASFAFFTTQKLTKSFSRKIHKINYTKISKAILIFLTLIVIIFTRLEGLIILTTSTALGLLATYTKTNKNLLMSALLIPTIIFYLPF